MPRRECLDCRRLTSNGARCTRCTRNRDAARGTTTQRGYGHADHQVWKEAWRPHVEAGGILCWRCDEVLNPADPWDLGHNEQHPSRPALPEHILCNRGTNRADRTPA
jgi:hypothetical protein